MSRREVPRSPKYSKNLPNTHNVTDAIFEANHKSEICQKQILNLDIICQPMVRKIFPKTFVIFGAAGQMAQMLPKTCLFGVKISVYSSV